MRGRPVLVLALALAACHKKHVELAFVPTCDASPERYVDAMRGIVGERGGDTDVYTRGGQLIVELPADTDDGAVSATRQMLERTAKLEVKLVDDGSVYMQHVVEHAVNDTRALAAGIAGDTDRWQSPLGQTRIDYHLRAPDRASVRGSAVIATYIAQLGASDPQYALPADRELAFLRTRDGWRSYLLMPAVELTGAGIAAARGSYSSVHDTPITEVELTPEGERELTEVSSRIVGDKVAVLLDGEIKSIQVVATATVGNKVAFATVARDKRQAEHERDDLVSVLRVGSLPCALRAAGVERR